MDLVTHYPRPMRIFVGFLFFFFLFFFLETYNMFLCSIVYYILVSFWLGEMLGVLYRFRKPLPANNHTCSCFIYLSRQSFFENYSKRVELLKAKAATPSLSLSLSLSLSIMGVSDTVLSPAPAKARLRALQFCVLSCWLMFLVGSYSSY